jgi:hypothetical protein
MNPTNKTATKPINKPISPLILVKTKISQSSNKSPDDYSDNENIWQSVQTVDSNKRIRSSLTKSPPPKKSDSNIFISKNRYAPISPTTENEPMDSTNEQLTNNTAENNTNKINPPPPIFIQAQLNYNAFCLKLQEITDSTSFACKTTTKGLKLQTFSPDSSRSIVIILKNENVFFHSYQSKENKPFRVVIRNLHPSTDKDHITKELSELGFQVKNITNVFQKSTKTPLPLFFIDLVQSQSNQDIFKLNSLCYSQVKVEAPHTNKEIPQCQRCQLYGHTRSYCNHTPRQWRSQGGAKGTIASLMGRVYMYNVSAVRVEQVTEH